jgi:hypothetical protein
MKGSGTGARKRIMTSNKTQKMKTNLRKTQKRKQYEKQMRKKGRHPMFEPLPGQAKKPGRKLTKKKEQMKQYEKTVGNRFRLNSPSLRQSAKKCFDKACKRSSRLLTELGKGMYGQGKRISTAMIGRAGKK